MRKWSHFALLLAALALLFAVYAAVELRRYPIPPLAVAGVYVALIWLFALYLAPGFAVSREWAARRVRKPSGWLLCAAMFLLPYLIYAACTGDFHWWAFARLAGLAGVPLGVFALAPVRHPERLNWQDAAVLLWLFIPVMFGWIGGIWNVPVNLDFVTRVFLVGVGAWAFLVVRGVEGAGYDFRFSFVLLRDAVVSAAWFTAIGMPLGLAIRFIVWHPQWRGLGALAIDYVTIFLFVAIAEELFFRGLLQNLLEGSLGSRGPTRWVAQGIASVLFGLSHIRHAPFPNWRYVLLATIAGWFYGWAYRKHRSLMASAATHAFVDTAWRTWFTLPPV
jgi:hypothetical protein